MKKFEEVLNEMNEIYIKKNHDYGNSFDQSLDKFGMVAGVVRLSDKMNRLETLMNTNAYVSESVRDTLIDMANYSVMLVRWLDDTHNRL
ncbi:MAG: DUF1599 domain-containing protein [Erysipelotrichaceae bacterium]|nr:DUF1599 domain-containing protein [Erysipelotrichaceae bacterium]